MAQSIERAIALVERVSERPLSLTEAAETLEVHKSTALRILQALEASRFVRKTSTGTYVLGNGLIELSQQALASMDLRQVAGPYLRKLHDETGHTVHLGQLFGNEIVYVDKVDNPTFDSVQIYSRIGRAVSLYASGVGKTVLAFRPEIDRERLLAGVELVQHTPTTFTTRGALDAEFSRIRDRGWATDNGELHSMVNCVSVPIRDSSREVVAAISITEMKAVAGLPELSKHLPLLFETAANVSREMGFVAQSNR